MSSQIEIPAIVSRFAHVVMAQSTRLGGVSEKPYASLNLGLHTEDDPGLVSENRKMFFTHTHAREESVAGGYQIHGTEIKMVETPGRYDGYDAFVTNVPGIFLTVTVADCVPILLYDTVRQAIAAIHAGWRGTVGRITSKTVACLSDAFGTDPSDCVAYIGTCISYANFEVGEEVANQFPAAFKRAADRQGTYFVDLKNANKQQLLEAGIKTDSIEVSPFCTVDDNGRFFSHRKEAGKTGRMLAIVGLTENGTS